MASICIIPARGGSKRIPRKNIKNFLGKPIIAYSINVAIESGLFDEVMVSTDDDEIAKIAQSYGAKVPFFRSFETSGDLATTMDVLKEVYERYRQLDKVFKTVCCLYPTAPFVKIEQLKEGLDLLTEKNLDAVFPVVAFSYPVWRGFEIEGGKTKMIWPENVNVRSQDLKKVYHDAGQWYWFKPDKIKGTLFTENVASIVLTEDSVQDIDNLTDWRIAEIKYRLTNG